MGRIRTKGYSISEVEKKTLVPRTSLRWWVRNGVLPPPPRGRGAHYDDHYVGLIVTIRRWRENGMIGETIIPELKTVPREQLIAEGRAAMRGAESKAAPERFPSETWERLVLIPGLELLVNPNAGELPKRLAREIWRGYGVAGPQ